MVVVGWLVWALARQFWERPAGRQFEEAGQSRTGCYSSHPVAVSTHCDGQIVGIDFI